jgi:hypothetical protein
VAKKPTSQTKATRLTSEETIVDPPNGGGGGAGGGGTPAVTGPLRAVKITIPADNTTVNGSPTLTIFAVPAVTTDRIIIKAYPQGGMGAVINLGEITPLTTATNYTLATTLASNTYMITATLVDQAGLQHDVSVIQVTVI